MQTETGGYCRTDFPICISDSCNAPHSSGRIATPYAGRSDSMRWFGLGRNLARKVRKRNVCMDGEDFCIVVTFLMHMAASHELLLGCCTTDIVYVYCIDSMRLLLSPHNFMFSTVRFSMSQCGRRAEIQWPPRSYTHIHHLEDTISHYFDSVKSVLNARLGNSNQVLF